MNMDKPLGAGLIAFGLAGIGVTMQISVRTFNDDPGPKLFPMIGFTILILCGLGMLLVKSAAEAKPGPDRGALTRGTLMFGLMVAYSLGLWIFGYYVATPIMVYAFYHVFAGAGRRVPWRGAVYALAVTGAVHLVFSTMLNTLLPTGMIF